MTDKAAMPGGTLPDTLIDAVRASIVYVESSIGSGSGYVALANGVIVTSQRVVGYERDVLVTTDDGTVAPAVVLRVNVALDVALLLPSEPLGLRPLPLGSAPPKLGEPTLLIGRVGPSAIAVTTTVAATERALDGIGYIQTQAAADREICGAALVDREGRLMGSLVSPRKRSTGGKWVHDLILPIAAFEGGLLSVDGPPSTIFELVPEYGCPRCDTVFEPGLDRCLECGILLPHPWSEPVDARGHAVTARARLDNAPERQAHHAVRVALGSVGIPPNRARVGPVHWRFSPGPMASPAVGAAPESRDIPIDLTVDDTGESLVLSAELARIPNGSFEPFYRHLLTLNGDGLGPCRLGIRDMSVMLTAFEPVSSIARETFPGRVKAFVMELERCQESLKRYFGVEPAGMD